MPATMLRPLSLGELLDRTFSLYKENFLLFFGVMVWPSLLAVAVGLLNTGLQSMAVRPGAGPSAQARFAIVGFGFVIGILLLMLAYWVAYTFALGATTLAVSDVYLGNVATISGSFKRMKGRTWRLMRLMLWIGLQLVLVFALLAIGIGVLAAVGRVVALVGMVILFPLIVCIPLWLMLRYSVSVPALMLEDLKAREAARRSGQLIKGNFGRAFLLLLLMVIITYAVMAVFQGPFFVAALVTAEHGQPSVWLLGLSSVFGALGGALAAPLLMIGLVLLYYDIRVRKEAFDLQLLMGPPLENVSGDSPAAAAAPSI
jgi:uncharacterized membrane protein